jgi:hypothetical protein
MRSPTHLRQSPGIPQDHAHPELCEDASFRCLSAWNAPPATCSQAVGQDHWGMAIRTARNTLVGLVTGARDRHDQEVAAAGS